MDISPYGMFFGPIMPLNLLKYRDLSPMARLAWLALAQFAGKNSYCFPSQETLSETLGVSTRNVRYLITELEGEGFIRIEKRQGNRGNIYFFIDHPTLVPDRSQEKPFRIKNDTQEDSFLSQRKNLSSESIDSGKTFPVAQEDPFLLTKPYNIDHVDLKRSEEIDKSKTYLVETLKTGVSTTPAKTRGKRVKPKDLDYGVEIEIIKNSYPPKHRHLVDQAIAGIAKVRKDGSISESVIWGLLTDLKSKPQWAVLQGITIYLRGRYWEDGKRGEKYLLGIIRGQSKCDAAFSELYENPVSEVKTETLKVEVKKRQNLDFKGQPILDDNYQLMIDMQHCVKREDIEEYKSLLEQGLLKKGEFYVS